MTLVFTLYSRAECHLCRDMESRLIELEDTFKFKTKVVDIDREKHLKALYGERVPILTLNDKEICHYYLDESELLRICENVN